MQVRRWRAVNQLRRHALGEVMQHEVLGEQVASRGWPPDRVQPKAFRLSDVCATIVGGRHCPQWSGMAGSAHLRMWSVLQRGGEPLSRVHIVDAGEPRAQADTGL